MPDADPVVWEKRTLDTCFYCFGGEITATFRGKTLTLVCGECNTGFSIRNVELDMKSNHFVGYSQ
jgi:hypothetical protein